MEAAAEAVEAAVGAVAATESAAAGLEAAAGAGAVNSGIEAGLTQNSQILIGQVFIETPRFAAMVAAPLPPALNWVTCADCDSVTVSSSVVAGTGAAVWAVDGWGTGANRKFGRHRLNC